MILRGRTSDESDLDIPEFPNWTPITWKHYQETVRATCFQGQIYAYNDGKLFVQLLHDQLNLVPREQRDETNWSWQDESEADGLYLHQIENYFMEKQL